MRATFSVFFLFEFIKCMKFFGLKSIRRVQLHFCQLTLQILSHSCVIQNNVFLVLNTRCFLTVCNALSVRRLWSLFGNMKNFYVKKRCDYYWITLQLELFYRVLWCKWQRVLRQVTTYDEWDCSSVSLKLKDDLCFFAFYLVWL